MSEQFKKSYNVKLPKSQHAVEEFGGGKAGLQMCSTCGAVYYKKHWHHDLESLNKSESTNVSKKDTMVKFVLCPACAMIKNNQYEGRALIKNVPKESVQKLEALIENFGQSAYELDSMHRLIGIKKSGADWEVTLTENQLANRLAKKIKAEFNTVKTKTHFVPEPSDVAEVTVEFSKK